jgi:uncharacterized membrane protein HdeD (DUF308 family)
MPWSVYLLLGWVSAVIVMLALGIPEAAVELMAVMIAIGLVVTGVVGHAEAGGDDESE